MSDLIERQAVLDLCESKDPEYKIRHFKEDVECLPSVSVEKTGRWIEERTYMECPNCNDIWHYQQNQTHRFKFCPTCGAKMEVEE